MTLQEIKKAVLSGKKVFWKNKAYEIIATPMKSEEDGYQWLIKCSSNNSCIGLTHRDGTTMNGEEEDFFSNN